MLRVLWTNKTALMANMEKMDVISNNLANSQMPGFKQENVSFQDLVGESLDRMGYPASKTSMGKDANSTGTGVRVTNLTRDNTQGTLNSTDRPGDLAIDGEGYLQLTSPSNQTLYSRGGSFSADSNGRLMDVNGNMLNINFDKGYNSGNVKFTDDNYQVTDSGNVLLKDKDSAIKVGNIGLYNAIGANGLLSVGGNIYVADKLSLIHI